VAVEIVVVGGKNGCRLDPVDGNRKPMLTSYLAYYRQAQGAEHASDWPATGCKAVDHSREAPEVCFPASCPIFRAIGPAPVIFAIGEGDVGDEPVTDLLLAGASMGREHAAVAGGGNREGGGAAADPSKTTGESTRRVDVALDAVGHHEEVATTTLLLLSIVVILIVCKGHHFRSPLSMNELGSFFSLYLLVCAT